MLSLSSKKNGMQNKGFTLVEMLVIAPIVILTIGSFIALIVNLTGEVLSSRGSNTLTYNVQDALNRIESDVRLSTGFLAKNNIAFSASNPQGYGAHGSTTEFHNIAGSDSPAPTAGPMLILNTLVTNGDPMQLTASTLYLANQPHSCTGTDDPLDYTKNRPMTMNIVYFTDSNGVLWRRSIMPSNYATASLYCGSLAPWQQPSCSPGYSSAFCRTNDVKLTDGVQNGNFAIEYFSNATSTTPIAGATNTAANADARGSALQAATTAKISLTTAKTIAGRDISRTGSLKVTRLDTNATSIATIAEPTARPAIPVVTGTVQNGNQATFTWPAVSTATSYDLQYRVNGAPAAYTTARTNIPSNERSYTVPGTLHGDRVEVRVLSRNARGTDGYGAPATVNIPFWTSLATENNWGDYSTNWAPPSYTKTRAGVVMLRGMVAGGALDTVIGTLPAGYRPGTKMLFTATSYDVFSRLDIDLTGTITQKRGTSSWQSLDGIAFLEGSPSSTALSPLLNGWVIHNAVDWHSPSYATDSAGRIHLRGMVRGGTTTTPSGTPTLGTGIVALPTAARPAAQNFYTPQASSDFFGMVGYNTGGQLRVRGGPAANTYLSMNMIYYPSSRATGTNCLTQWCNMTLLNSWANYGSSFTTAQYTKATDGIVHLKGTVRLGTTGRIATLTREFCPTTKLLMTISTNDNLGRLDVVPDPAGGCHLDAAVYNNTWVSLDGIKYIADQ